MFERKNSMALLIRQSKHTLSVDVYINAGVLFQIIAFIFLPCNLPNEESNKVITIFNLLLFVEF